MNASSRAPIVVCLSLAIAPATGGCGGRTDPISVDALVSPACQDNAGTCSLECLTLALYQDVARSCYESAQLCAPAPLARSDGGRCEGMACYVNLADGSFIASCVAPSASRWRPCSSKELASVQPIWQECPPPPVHGGQIFY